ncbi:MAG: hypothetical protein AB1597_01815 [Chloroflexota bacterium]
MMKWLKDTIGWFKAHWLEWATVLIYIGILYWMASLNWQVIRFPVFFAIFTAISITLIVSFRYIKSPPLNPPPKSDVGNSKP